MSDGRARLSLAVSRLAIPFRQRFAHASAARDETQALLVTVSREGLEGVGEGCPREYVTGEDLETAEAFIGRHRSAWMRDVTTPAALAEWAATHAGEIDASPAAWCAVELACLDLFGRERGQSVEHLLGVAPVSGRYRYTAVVGDSDGAVFAATVARYRQAGFDDFKIKLSGDLERDREKVAVLREVGVEAARVRADANNLWRGAAEAARHVESLGTTFAGIEEPVAVGRLDGLREVARRTGSRMILDESLVRGAQLDALAADPQAWIVNVRVSKMGGLRRSLDVVARARALGIAVIVGAQVGETSVLTRAALPVATAAGPALVGQEGAFGTWLLEHDICDSPLMFGTGGVLDADALGLAARPGLGITRSGNSASFQGPRARSCGSGRGTGRGARRT